MWFALPPAELAVATRSGRVSTFEKCSQLGCRPELRDGIEFVERARERIGETPSRPRGEVLDLGIEIQVVDAGGQVLGNIQLTLHKRPVDDQLRGLVREAGPLPGLDLLPHGLEVPLHAVHPHRKDVHQAEILGVLREDGSEHT